MVREARFAWDSEYQPPRELSRTDWDCEDPELELDLQAEIVKRKKKSRRRSIPKSENDPTEST